MNVRLWLIGLLVFTFVKTTAQSKLKTAIQKFIKEESLTPASVGICLLDVKTGKVVAQHDSKKSLSPASSLKLVTTATALALLGENYRFKTVLQYDGTINNGVLDGNIYLKGYGDPTLGSDKMEGVLLLDELLNRLTEAIKKEGITSINGLVVGDASYFSTEVAAPSWQWNDLGNYYAAGAFGLNIHENLYYLAFLQNQSLGAKPKIHKIEPVVPNMLMINEVQNAASDSGDNAYIYGAPYSFTRFVRGTIPVGSSTFTIKGAIPDPPLMAAQLLNKRLRAKGIESRGLSSTQLELNREGRQLSKSRKTIDTIESPTLGEIVKRTNLESINLYVETMLRAIGKKRFEEGSPEKGLDAIYEYWREKGMPLEGFFMEDGSGLSPRTAVSTFHLAKLLQIVAKNKTIYPAFEASLPVGGKTGTLKRMFRGTIGEGRVLAKTGSMERIRSYTGYIKKKNGQQLSFSIIVNNYTGPTWTLVRKIEKLLIEAVR